MEAPDHQAELKAGQEAKPCGQLHACREPPRLALGPGLWPWWTAPCSHPHFQIRACPPTVPVFRKPPCHLRLLGWGRGPTAGPWWTWLCRVGRPVRGCAQSWAAGKDPVSTGGGPGSLCLPAGPMWTFTLAGGTTERTEAFREVGEARLVTGCQGKTWPLPAPLRSAGSGASRACPGTLAQRCGQAWGLETLFLRWAALAGPCCWTLGGACPALRGASAPALRPWSLYLGLRAWLSRHHLGLLALDRLLQPPELSLQFAGGGSGQLGQEVWAWWGPARSARGQPCGGGAELEFLLWSPTLDTLPPGS
ncbi:uncharacterized protein LOC131425001 [Marmota monax]|uniref:uncharacterized protein LOC131425001 n=1 Tax=Marmota monax TaxID=9995 RepID=UPI0026EF0550|nr:uncharacterized protein LOC131425001 [Marmota monax]